MNPDVTDDSGFSFSEGVADEQTGLESVCLSALHECTETLKRKKGGRL